MKLKYYLRGMAIGIIAATIILTISFSGREPEISDEQVMVRAAALGMMMPEEGEPNTASTETKVEPDIVSTENGIEPDTISTENGIEPDAASTETETEKDTEQTSENDSYWLVIQKGDVCRIVCEKLQENGVVDDAEALRKHLFEVGYANNISVGEYDIPYGLTMEQVAEIIVAGPIE